MATEAFCQTSIFGLIHLHEVFLRELLDKAILENLEYFLLFLYLVIYGNYQTKQCWKNLQTEHGPNMGSD